MEFRKILIYLLLSFCCIKNYAQNDSVFNAEKIATIALINLKDNNASRIVEKEKPSLFIFLSPDCPLCKNYSSVLNDIQTNYGDKINCYGIIPGKTYSKKELILFQTTYKINYPILIDQQLKLSKYLKATATPEVILLDKKKTLVYKGAIDDLLQKLGKQKLKATKFYLKDAIESLLSQRAVEIKRTTAVGCKLNDY